MGRRHYVVKTYSGWAYAAFVVDVFSRRVVGWRAVHRLPLPRGVHNSPLPMLQAEKAHRAHAIVEQVIADLKNGPLAHLPGTSGPTAPG